MILQPAQVVDRVQSIALRCPGCRRMGTFDGVLPHDELAGHLTGGPVYLTGLRSCPNPSCRALVYFVWDTQGQRLAASYPAERLDFDPTNIPTSVTKALEEAITCHANGCFIASAIMVRKTLEQLCQERGATGGGLRERLRTLGARIVIPQELLAGLDDLRLLGNDAAHIESQEFNTVGQQEVEIGIEFAKEVLKAVYQYSDLLAKLRSLKRTP